MNITYPLLIDGGLSNVLDSQGCQLDRLLWSAGLLATHPEAILEAHLAYLRAGARCITTASYQATIPGFLKAGYGNREAESCILRSVTLALQAVEQFMASERAGDRPLVAASIGPYGAYLADGSEYRGNYGLSEEELAEFHRPRLDLLDRSEADLIAVETIPDLREAKALARLLMKTSKKAWVSFSCKDGLHLNDGSHIGESAAVFAGHPNVFAIGVNCTAPGYISDLIKVLKVNCGNKKIIIYPNSGEVYHAASKSWRGTADPGEFVVLAKEWIDLGADIIGGCCRIGPDHIDRLAAFLQENEG